MFNGMKHIAITMLGLVLLAMLVACEGPGSALENQFLGPPTATPDVEATVEARVEIAKARSEERPVGKEGRSGGSRDH